MPYRITFVLGAFDGDRSSPARRILRHQTLYEALAALTRINVRILSAAKPGAIPKLYDSGVRYIAEPEGAEDWLDILSALRQLRDPKLPVDCEDLACWRAAELQMEGIEAHPVFLWRRMPDGSHLYHIVVRYPDGRIEDPSKRLGMR